jgi:hypothetical protein
MAQHDGQGESRRVSGLGTLHRLKPFDVSEIIVTNRRSCAGFRVRRTRQCLIMATMIFMTCVLR